MKILLLVASLTVVDGDTFKDRSTSYRLWGIDAPEMREPEGRAAKEALRGLLRGRHSIVCQDMGTDRYRRTVARCDEISCALVAQGHARDWPRYSRGAYRDC